MWKAKNNGNAISHCVGQMAHDIPCQLREPLARAIKQLRALYQPVPLVKMAEANDASAAWALQQLQIHHPEDYADTLIASFRDADPKSRGMIFSTLAAAYPPGAKMLRETLTDQQAADLAIELARFEQKQEPELAKSRIPELLEIAKDAAGNRDYGERGPAIELLSALPLDEAQRAQFEELLLARAEDAPAETLQNLDSSMDHRGADQAPRSRPPLGRAGQRLGKSHGVRRVLQLPRRALNPRPRQTRDPEDANRRFRPSLFHPPRRQYERTVLAALALDLRELAPEIAHLASNGPECRMGNARTAGAAGSPDPETTATTSPATSPRCGWRPMPTPAPGCGSRSSLPRRMISPGNSSIVADRLRDGFRSALAVASPGVGEELKSKVRRPRFRFRDCSIWPNEARNSGHFRKLGFPIKKSCAPVGRRGVLPARPQGRTNSISHTAMAYAVIKTGGKQYRIQEGDKFDVEKLDAEVDSTVTFDVLIVGEGESVKIGAPLVEGASVTAKVINQYRGPKGVAFKFKRRKGFHKNNRLPPQPDHARDHLDRRLIPNHSPTYFHGP